MKNRLFTFTFLSMAAVVFFMASGCMKEEVDNKATLKKLYKTYRNGEISECRYNGQAVFSAILNEYDAAGAVYDKDGNRIATCNYATGNVDAICEQLTNCEVVYRVDKNI